MWVYELKTKNGEISKGYRDTNTPNAVKAKVLYSGINRRDIWIHKGLYPGIEFPIVMGSDACLRLNDKKYIINPNIDWGDNSKVPGSTYNILGMENDGTFAEYVCTNMDRLHLAPEHLTDQEVAVLGLAGLTAYRSLISNCQLRKGDRVFINGIGGAVAQMAMQFALALGCEVHISSSSSGKNKRAIEMGASGSCNYMDENWGKLYKKANGGFDVIIDSAGGKGFKELINLCNIGGRIGIYGGTRGAIESISPQHLFFKQIHIFGSTMGNDQEFRLMLDLVSRFKIKPIVDKEFTISDINKAFEYGLSKERFGKIALSH
jgi:NADPH:quinone reductase-like Zn-dependent oxidoreductase